MLRVTRHFLSGSALAAATMLFSRYASAQGVTLAQIKSAGELRISCEASYVPFTFRQAGLHA